MTVDTQLKTLGGEGLERFQRLEGDAVRAVTDRFYATYASAYERFGARGREATRQDLAYHLEFLRPVLEFGLLQPMVEYLRWLESVLAARAVPAQHLALSLDWLAEFYSSHLPPQDGLVVAEALRAARAGFLEAGTAPAAPPSPEEWPDTFPLEAALLAGNQRAAMDVLTSCMDAGKSLVDVEIHVIQPALYRIGEKWQANVVSVAQEHMATAMVQALMTVGLLRSEPPAAISRRVLLACVAGNDHAVGLRMVADAFQLGGWDVHYLGANVPTVSLIAHVSEWKPDLVGLSMSFAQQLPTVKAIIAQLAERFGNERPAVMVGGLAVNRFDRLPGIVGADAFGADARAAVLNASQLVSVGNGA